VLFQIHQSENSRQDRIVLKDFSIIQQLGKKARKHRVEIMAILLKIGSLRKLQLNGRINKKNFKLI